MYAAASTGTVTTMRRGLVPYWPDDKLEVTGDGDSDEATVEDVEYVRKVSSSER